MPVLNVGVNSTFEQQRQIINSISVDVFTLSSTLSGLTTTGLVVTYSNVAGVATYASVAGISTYAIVSGISSYAVISGVATVANYAQVAGIASALNFIPNYSHNAGVASYAPVAGIATVANYATSSSSSTFAFYAGISTYAGTAGIATVAQGISGTPNVQVGIITASLFVGNGSQLTGVNTNFVSSIGIQSSGTTIGVGITQLNFVGTGNTFAVNGTTVNISIAGGGGSGIGLSISDTPPANTTTYPLWYSSLLGRSFVYYNDGDSSQWVDFSPTSSGGSVVSGGSTSQWVTIAAGIHTLSNVGIGTTNPTSKLTVSGDALINGITVGLGGSAVTNNTAIGSSALYSNTTGNYNTANGNFALNKNTTGNYNVANGYNALQNNFADGNVANGANALYLNTSGQSNTANGYQSMFYNTTGQLNTATGRDALLYNNGGSNNVATGFLSLYRNTSGSYNVAIGVGAGQSITTGDYNTAIGSNALNLNTSTSANYNTGIGAGAGKWITTGNKNTLLGSYDGNQNGLDIRTSNNNVVLSDGDGNIRFYANSSGNVGLGTTNPTSKLTVTGNVLVSGVSTFRDYLDINNSSSSSSSLRLHNVSLLSGATNFTKLSANSSALAPEIGGGYAPLHLRSNNEIILQSVTDSSPVVYAGFTTTSSYLNYLGVTKLQTIGTGVTITGTTFTNQLNVSGNVLVSGVSTLTSNVSVGGTISINGGVKLETNNATIVGTSGSTGEIKRIAGAPFFYDGSAWREFVLSSGTPVTVPADTDWDNTILRCDFENNANDLRFGQISIPQGSAAVTSSQYKFGTKSLRVDSSSSDAIIFQGYPNRPEYNFEGEWTIEGWYYFNATRNYPGFNQNNGSSRLFSVSNPSTGANIITVNFQCLNIQTYNNIQKIVYGSATTGNTDVSWQASAGSANEILPNLWYHIAVQRSSTGLISIIVNGNRQGSYIENGIVDISNEYINIGLGFYGNASYPGGFIDDFRISTIARYSSTANSTPPTTALPITGTLSSYVQPPGDKYGEIVLGGSPTWRGTSGVTVSQQSSGNYRVSFASTYTNSNDYFVLSHAMDQGFASYVGIARSTTHVDFSINKESDNAVVNTGSLAVQIKNHP